MHGGNLSSCPKKLRKEVLKLEQMQLHVVFVLSSLSMRDVNRGNQAAVCTFMLDLRQGIFYK